MAAALLSIRAVLARSVTRSITPKQHLYGRVPAIAFKSSAIQHARAVSSAATMAPPTLETMSIAMLDNGIGIIKFNRPQNANALGAQAMEDLRKALSWANQDDEVKVVILSGEGRFFSAGMDLVDVPATGPVLSDESVEALR